MRRRAALLLAASLALLAPPAPTRAGGAEIKLATWNIAWLTAKPPDHPDLPRDVSARSPDDLARLRDYLRRLDADVLALQEVDGPEGAALVLDGAEWRVFFPRERDVQRSAVAVREGRGLRAAQNPDLAALDLRAGARFSLRRGVDVTVEAGASRLRVLSVHLNSGCRDGAMEGSRECDSLRDQAAVLAGWVADRRAAGDAYAVAGDFNRRMDREDDFLPTLDRAASPGPPLLRTTRGVSNPCWGGRPFIDHVLLGGPARGWLVEGSLRVLVYAERGPGWRDRLSDHCPVSVRLRLP